MPIGEFIVEAFSRVIFEVVFYGIAYYTGAAVISVVTLGQIRLAPLSTFRDRNKNKKWWNDWGIWLHRPMQKKALRAELVCVIGLFTWIAAGVTLYSISKY